MPAREKYGAQPPIELLRQWMDHGIWYAIVYRCIDVIHTYLSRYDKKDTTQMKLVDIQFLAAMGPPGGGKNPITERFLRHFNVIGVTTFSDETMSRIFSSLVSFYLKANSFPNEYFATGTQIVQATLEVCVIVCVCMCACACVLFCVVCVYVCMYACVCSVCSVCV